MSTVEIEHLKATNAKLTACVKEEREVYQRMLTQQFKLEAINDELLAACEDMLAAFEYAGTRLVGAEFAAKQNIIAAIKRAREGHGQA